MYILVAPDAASDTKLAYGVVILQPSEVDMFADWAAQKAADGGSLGGLGPVLAFDGLRDHPYDTGHIMDALESQGFTAAPNFTYIDPFMKGRAAGLAIKSRDKSLDIAYTYYGAAFFVFLGILKLGLRMRRKGQGPSAAAPVAKTPTAVVSPAMRMPTAAPPLASNDFIGALARKAAAPSAASAATPAQTKLAPTIGSDRPRGHQLRGFLGSKMRAMAGVAGAAALYLVFAGFGGSFGLPNSASIASLFWAKPAVTEIIMVQAPQTPVQAPNLVQKAQLAAPQAPTDLDATPAQTTLLAAVPLWLWASLLVTIIVLPILLIFGKRHAAGGKGAVKSTTLDPFERLLQRRLAEKGRAEKAVMGGMGLLRA